VIESILDKADAVADGSMRREALAGEVYGLVAERTELGCALHGLPALELLVIDSPLLAARLIVAGCDWPLRSAYSHFIRCVFGNPCPHPVREKYGRLKAVGLGLLKLVAGHPNLQDESRQHQSPSLREAQIDDDWLTSTVVALARQMYESRDFGAMPILADALQDAGCDSDDILDHCRGDGPHVRGCWVIDLVLGKS
jgi:hypothetical protein